MIRKLYFSCDSKNLRMPNRSYSSYKPTYYDVLNVKKNSTNKEIRNSFLKLSKKFHPDIKGINNNTKTSDEYLKIMEAYQILSKKDSRYLYDLSLDQTVQNVKTTTDSNHTQTTRPRQTWRVTPDYNPNPGPYYGIKGIPKISNFKVVGILLFLATVGTIFEFYLVRNSMTFRRDQLDEKSREAGLMHASVRADAEKYGNAKQLERIAEKILQRNND